MKDTIKEIAPTMQANIGVGQRIVSVLSGSVLLYDALAKRKSITEGIAAGYLIFRGATGYCAATDALGKVAQEAKAATNGHAAAGEEQNTINIETQVRVPRPHHEVYEFWRKLENLPQFMHHLESVTQLDKTTSEWKAKIPGGIGTIDWKAEITEDKQFTRISWQSVKDADIENAGTVEFINAGKQGTDVKVTISYKAPAGKMGQTVGKWLNPVLEDMVKEDIERLKTQFTEGDAANNNPEQGESSIPQQQGE